MILEILTPESSVFSGEIVSVTLPGLGGEFQLLQNHAAIISALKKGVVTFKTLEPIAVLVDGLEEDTTSKNIFTFSISGGVVEMMDNKVVLLAE